MSKLEYNISTKKVEIYVDETDKELRDAYYKRLRDISYNSYRYANDIVNKQYFKDLLKLGIGNVDNTITSDELKKRLDSVTQSSEMNFGYKYTSTDLKNALPSYVRVAVNNVVFQNYNSDKKEVLRGDRSIRNYRRNSPVYFSKDAIRGLKKTDGKDFQFQLLSTPMKTKLGRDRSNNESVFNSILSGKYLMCDSQFQFKDDKLYLLLVIKMPKETVDIDENKTLGVDLGINIPIYVAVNDGYSNTGFGSRDDLFAKKQQFYNRRRSLQSNLKIAKGGKGRNKKLKSLNAIKTLEKDYTKTYIHTITSSVIKYATSQRVGKILLEDLSTVKDHANDVALRNWNIYDIQQMITYKANRIGISVEMVDPAYSSQRCNKCGNIDSDNRPTQEKFECVKCGHTDNADRNAAKNLSIANTEKYKKEIKKHKDSVKQN
jgi:IS605 OrfB family transposase